ncbi:uncharacterized protein TNCV_1288631 [Trichonephila clavipes]|nr:uncharacterized protein TNCV_1288631 [Trichonephila clavipes]
MAPKTKEVSLEMRKHSTELHKEGKSFREIGKILKLSFTTVGYIVKKYLETGSVENKPRPGGPSKLTSRAKRMIARSATNKAMTSAQNIANELLSLSSCNVSVSAQTVRIILHKAGLKARTPRKKPYISEVNRKRRLEFAMKTKISPWIFGKSAKKLSMKNTFIFQQDNDPKHTAIVTKTWLLYHAPRRRETLPQSPDLNPIENLWMHLYTEFRGGNVTSKENLKEKLQEVWNSIETQKSQRN